jgi:hypothetical protein
MIVSRNVSLILIVFVALLGTVSRIFVVVSLSGMVLC